MKLTFFMIISECVVWEYTYFLVTETDMHTHAHTHTHTHTHRPVTYESANILTEEYSYVIRCLSDLLEHFLVDSFNMIC